MQNMPENGLLANIKFLLLLLFLSIVLFNLQYKLLFSPSSLFNMLSLRNKIVEETNAIEKFRIKNNKLAAKIMFLKQNPKAYEEHARHELGMKKTNEQYYQVVIPVKN